MPLIHSLPLTFAPFNFATCDSLARTHTHVVYINDLNNLKHYSMVSCSVVYYPYATDFA